MNWFKNIVARLLILSGTKVITTRTIQSNPIWHHYHILFGIFKSLFSQIIYLQLSRGLCETISFYTQPPKAFLIQIKIEMP